MEISRYLAMTAAEAENASLPECFAFAYMACHFSPYGTALTNLPVALPAGSMLILNDRTPVYRHDPGRILAQLTQLLEEKPFDCLLLDFQRPGQQETSEICRVLTRELPCAVGVSDWYARDLEAPVFLPPVPLWQPAEEYLAPWQDREIWLDTAPQAARITVTEAGSVLTTLPFSPPPENAFREDQLHCLYRPEVGENEIRFHLWRDEPMVEKLTGAAAAMGVAKTIGLYQEFFPSLPRNDRGYGFPRPAASE